MTSPPSHEEHLLPPPVFQYPRQKWSLARRIRRLSADWLFLGVLVVGFAVAAWWVVVGPGVTDWLSLDDNQWNNLSALSTTFAFAFGSIAGLVVLFELVEASDSRNLTIYQDIYERFMSEEQIDARRFIYKNLWQGGQYDGDFAALEHMPQTELEDQFSDLFDEIDQNEKAQRQIKTVLNAMDYFGFLADQDWVTEDQMIGWVSPIVVKVWAKIGPRVVCECRKREEEPDYYLSARRLAVRCQDWREQRLKNRTRTSVLYDESRL